MRRVNLPRSLPSHTLALTTLLLAGAGAEAGTVAYVNAAGTCDYPTIQAAVNDLPAGSEIRLASNEFVLNSALSVFNREVRIVGGYPACGAPASTSTTTLRAGFSGDAVVSILGNVPGALSLDLVNLDLVDANNPTGNGGGMLVIGQGQINLYNVGIFNNIAEDGAGIYLQSIAPGPLGVSLLAGTQVGAVGAGNDALRIGGGVYCAGARVRLGATQISGNSAAQSGGGVRAFDACQLISTADVGDTRIDGNSASEGGGIFASSGTQIELQSRPGQRLSISGNVAQGDSSPRGGGVYLTNSGTQFIAHGAWIENNQAQLTGAGLFVTNGASATLDRGTDACALGDDQCSRIAGNQLRNADGSLSGNGAGVFVSSAQASISHTRIENNSSFTAAALRASGSAQLLLSNVLISQNSSSLRLINIEGDASAGLDLLTIADNSFVGAAINVSSTAPAALSLARSIFLVPEGNSHVSGAGATQFSCLNTGAGGALGGDAHLPAFFDAANGIYRLRNDSQNLDRCTAMGGESPVDLAGLPRVIDRPGTPNNIGPVDRGAFEDVESLLMDGFED
ncbi:MAG: hypothetical protein KDI51_08460 [Xanthomonadales bacterium]|nr:hypothetical protein [Xanthomonadales bacterium]